jgi:hypothetical protein
MIVLPAFALLGSLIFFPWWLTVLAAWWLSQYRYSLPLLVGCGLLMDLWFGYPVDALNGFQYIYTCIFVGMGCVASAIRVRILE